MLGGYIDSRSLEDRLDELLDIDVEDRDVDEREELDRLTAVCTEGRDAFSEWPDGVSLIPENDFEDYARDFAIDIGVVGDDTGWPVDYIDWERAADALKMDYTSIEIEGTTYWGR
jgi:hypothetical protein